MIGDGHSFVCSFLDSRGQLIAAQLLEARTDNAAKGEAEALHQAAPNNIHAYEVWRDDSLIERGPSGSRSAVT